MIREKRVVITTSLKVEGGDVYNKMLIPSMWCLFETVEGFYKMTYIVRILRINITMEVFHVNLFINVIMKECVFDF